MHDLAGHLKRTVNELRRSMTHAEFIDWIAYQKLQPFGEFAADYRAGLVASTLANVNRNPKTRSQPFEWLDFFPWHKPRDFVKQQLKKMFPKV